MPIRPTLTDALWAKLLQAFRDNMTPAGPSYRSIAKAVGMDVRTVVRAWEPAWPRRVGPWSQPIRAIVEREQLEARARLATGSPPPKEVVGAAKVDAAEQLAASVTLTRNCRKAASAFLGIVATMIPPALELARKLSDDAKSGAFKSLKSEEAARITQRVARVAQAAITMAETAQIMEHREAGKPTDILALAGLGSDGPPLSLEEAERELRAAQNALQRAKELGIVAIDGNGALKN